MCVHTQAARTCAPWLPHAQDRRHSLPPLRGDTRSSPGMDRYWRGTSQRRGHSADIQSARGFLVPCRPGKLPGALTCPGITGAQNARFQPLRVVAVRTKPRGSLPGGDRKGQWGTDRHRHTPRSPKLVSHAAGAPVLPPGDASPSGHARTPRNVGRGSGDPARYGVYPRRCQHRGTQVGPRRPPCVEALGSAPRSLPAQGPPRGTRVPAELGVRPRRGAQLSVSPVPGRAQARSLQPGTRKSPAAPPGACGGDSRVSHAQEIAPG